MLQEIFSEFKVTSPLKDICATIFHSIDFLKFLLQSDNELLVPEMQKNRGSPSLFQI